MKCKKENKKTKKELNSKTDIGWGHQIRSYVLQPYQLVKDLRNKVENTNPSDVLNGNIDQFIEAGIINNNEKNIFTIFFNFFFYFINFTILSTIGLETERFNNLFLIKLQKITKIFH